MLVQAEGLINKCLPVAIDFKQNCVLPECCKLVPKQVVDDHLMFLLIKYVHLVGVTSCVN